MVLVRERDRKIGRERKSICVLMIREDKRRGRINFANLTFYQFSLFGILWR